MALPFLDRAGELARLRRLLARRAGGLAVVYGRRRVGKSRLVQEAISGRPAAYYVGDDRDAPVQREALARELASLIPGFSQVRYPDWASLLDAFARAAPRGAVLAIDELPSLVRRSPELPSLLQKLVDRPQHPHLVLAGSSQRMMQGLVLDGAAPLFGRAQELLKLLPLEPGWLAPALAPRTPLAAVELWAVLGGVPRYWDLARGKGAARTVLRHLALDRLGPLHAEPDRLLLDDFEDLARVASVLALVAGGAHRPREIAGRLELPMTTLARPLGRLVDLGLLRRDVPFGESRQDSKRALYRVADPFLRSWYRFVEPNRSRLERGDLALAEGVVARQWGQHLAEAWGDLAREVPADARWATGERWWGKDAHGPVELDLVCKAVKGRRRVLVGEVKLTLADSEVERELARLQAKIERCPALAGLEVERALFVLRGTKRPRPDVITGERWWAAAAESCGGGVDARH